MLKKNHSTNEFIKKSLNKFGNFLDYSLVEYISSTNKIILICPKHGEFQRTPNVHLNSKFPCPFCSKKVMTTDEFIKKAQGIHGNKFVYDDCIYVSYTENIKLYCQEHGLFFTSVQNHLKTKKGGCPGCNERKNVTTKKFIKRSKQIHGDLYNYSLCCYTNNNTKVKIICKKHGVFEQTPANHYKYGCLKCSGKYLKSNDEFIKECVIIHENKFDYSKTKYKGMFKKIAVICKDHGEFNILATNHIHNRRGCPRCSKRISKNEVIWLDYMGVPRGKKYRNVYIKIDTKKYWVDGFDPDNNIIYEFNGDYWHGNPKIYNSEKIHPEAKITFGEMYNRTIQKQKHLESHGFKVISIWESEFVLCQK